VSETRNPLVDDLINAAYDSGYYSGRNEDGSVHHQAAIAMRENLRREVEAKVGYAFTAYQAQAARTANPAFAPLRRLVVSALGLAAEAGEVASLLQKGWEQDWEIDDDKLVAELGDCLWRIADICSSRGLNMGAVAQANIEKLRRRYPEGFTPAGSVERKDQQA
jgi:NTP pyrophosphatase (non-canonical NTP hydrolase)